MASSPLLEQSSGPAMELRALIGTQGRRGMGPSCCDGCGCAGLVACFTLGGPRVAGTYWHRPGVACGLEESDLMVWEAPRPHALAVKLNRTLGL